MCPHHETDRGDISDIGEAVVMPLQPVRSPEAATAIHDGRTRVAWIIEGAGLAVVGQDGPLQRILYLLLDEIVPCIRDDVVGAGYGKASGPAAA
jgi:hypothetical protein